MGSKWASLWRGLLGLDQHGPLHMQGSSLLSPSESILSRADRHNPGDLQGTIPTRLLKVMHDIVENPCRPRVSWNRLPAQ